MPNIIDLVDIEIEAGTTEDLGLGLDDFGTTSFGAVDLTAGALAYKYSSFEDNQFPNHIARILNGINLSRGFSDPTASTRSATIDEFSTSVTLNNHKIDSGVEGPSISQIKSSKELRDRKVNIRKYDLESDMEVLSVYGVITSVGSITRSQASFTVSDVSTALLKTDVPNRLLSYYFPNLDASKIQDASKAIPIFPFGTMKKIELFPCIDTFIQITFNMVAVASNFLIVDITSVTDFTVVAGDVLYYDIELVDPGALITFYIRASDGTSLRGSGAVDQMGYTVNESTTWESKARNKFYRRKIILPASLYGKTISQYLIRCDYQGTGVVRARLANIYIKDSNGNIRKNIYHSQTGTPVFAEFLNGNINVNFFTASKNAGTYYGAVQNLPTITFHTVYFNNRVMDPTQYVIIGGFPSGSGLLTVRFIGISRDSNGSLPRIHVDISTSFFGNNFANVAKYVFENSLFLGQVVDAAGFTTAMNDFNAVSPHPYKVSGGLTQQLPAENILSSLALRNSRYRRTASGYTMLVDKIGLHSAASIAIGENDSLDWKNAIITEESLQATKDLKKKLTFEGGKDAGFENSSSFTIRSSRSRAVPGVEETIELEFVDDINTLDEEADFRFKLITMYDERYSASMDVDAAALTLVEGMIVKLYVEDIFLDGVEVMVSRIEYGENDVSLDLVKWNSSLFTYVLGDDIFVDPQNEVLTDYSHTFPGAPTALAEIGTAVIRIASDDSVEAIRKFQVLPPAVNISDIDFQVLRQGTAVILQTHSQPVEDVNTFITQEIVFKSGNDYTVRARSRNSANAPGFQAGAFSASLNITGPELPTPPDVPTWDAEAPVVQSQLTNILKFEDKADAKTVRIYRGLTDIFADASLRGTSGGSQFTDTFTSAAFGKRFYYFLTALGFTGLVSAATASRSIVVVDPAVPLIVETKQKSSTLDVIIEAADGSVVINSLVITLGTGRVEIDASCNGFSSPGFKVYFKVRRGSPTGPIVLSSTTSITASQTFSINLSGSDTVTGTPGSSRTYYMTVDVEATTNVQNNAITLTSYN